MEKILLDLVAYTKEHLAAEEDLLRKHSYPQANAHKAEHERVVAPIQEFRRDSDSGRVTVPIEIIQFVMDWLTDHILGVDKLYVDYLNGKGAS